MNANVYAHYHESDVITVLLNTITRLVYERHDIIPFIGINKRLIEVESLVDITGEMVHTINKPASNPHDFQLVKTDDTSWTEDGDAIDTYHLIMWACK